LVSVAENQTRHRKFENGPIPTIDADLDHCLNNYIFAPFLSHVSTLMPDIDIANLSVCDVPVSDENGSTYCRIFFTIR